MANFANAAGQADLVIDVTGYFATIRPTPLPECRTTCTRYSPCEITLSTTDSGLSEATLFSIRLRANFTFTGTGTPETKNVPGFYFDRPSHGSGPARFKLRFTPSQTGSYHYDSFSSYAGLDNQHGDFTCTAAVPLPGGGGTNHGFLRRDPNNVYSYVWEDNSSNHFFMWGQTYYQIVNQARRNIDNDDTWHTAVNKTRLYEMNKIRLLISPWSEEPFNDPANPGRNETQPYCTETQSANCEVPGGAFDFTRVNLDHFVALDEVVDYLFGKGMLAELIIFRDPNSATGVSMLGTEAQNKQYLRYVIARYAAYPNVTWSLSNEWQCADSNPTHWDTLGNCIRSGCTDSLGPIEADPWLLDLGGTKRRPLTIHPSAKAPPCVQDPNRPVVGNCFSFTGSAWPNNGSLQYGSDQGTSMAGYSSIACNRRVGEVGSCPGGSNRSIPYVNDEYGYIGKVNSAKHRKLIWGIVTGGGYGTAGDFNNSVNCPYASNCGPAIRSTIWADQPFYYIYIKNMIQVIAAKNVPYWSMSPRDVCPESDNIHTLGNTTSRKFLVYFAQPGTSPANQVPAGNYTAVWYQPGGDVEDANDHHDYVTVNCQNYANGIVTAPPPGGAACANCDWVVYLTGC